MSLRGALVFSRSSLLITGDCSLAPCASAGVVGKSKCPPRKDIMRIAKLEFVVGYLEGFVIKFRCMDDTPLFKKPWFYIAGWLAVLLVVYGWQIYRLGGIQASLIYIFFDLACIFPALLILWFAFFAQFVLPVRTFYDRQKIFERLLTRLSGGHGPALFIENGVIKEHSGERLKNGPGVVWLDSASAAVTRTAVRIKQTPGPGVHFLDNGEFIAGTVDLHIQSQSLGLKESDKPFDPQGENQDAAEYNQMQDRRKQVSALTRDGIEVIPTISVTFRVDTGFPKEGQPGSRFGYRIAVTKKDKEREEKDKAAIHKAILGEGINPNIQSDSPRHRVAWNQLPAVLAVDVWREYVAKFTLDELFKQDQLIPPPLPELPQPTEEEVDPLSQPLQTGATRNNIQDGLTAMLREINLFMSRAINWLDGTKKEAGQKTIPELKPPPTSAANSEPQKKTALQVINEMVKARLTQPEVVILDDHGVRGTGTIPSAEFMLLQKRGLKVLGVGVSIGNLSLNPLINEKIIDRWSATWHNNAKSESDQIARKKDIIESAGQEKALLQYADRLSRDLVLKKPIGVKNTLKTLLMRTRTIIINDDKLRHNMVDAQGELEEIIKWTEVNE